MAKKVKVKSYESELEYMEDVLVWLENRCKFLITQKWIDRQNTTDEVPGQWIPQTDQSPQVLRHKLVTYEEQLVESEEILEARSKKTREEGKRIAIDELCELYGLDEFERTILLMASAVAFSARFQQFYGQLQDGFDALTVETVYNFFELPFAERIRRRRYFSKSSPLLRHDLVSMDLMSRFNAPEDLLRAVIQLSNRTFGYLVGHNDLMDEFMEFSSVEEPHSRFDQVVLSAEDKRRILSVVERHEEYLKYRKEWGFDEVISYGRGALMLFHGKPGTGKTMMAHAVAEKMGKRVLNVDIPTFANHAMAERFLPSLFREARMQNALLFFDECEVLFADRRHGNILMTLLLTEIERFEGVAILATNMPGVLDEALDRRILVKVRFPVPDRQSRREIWEKHLPEQAPVDDDVDLDSLAERFEMTGGYIKNAILTAVAEAVHTDEEDPKITMGALERGARAQLTPVVDDESPLMEPKVRLTDVVLPEDLKEKVVEIVDAARHQRTILERWGIGEHLSHGKGVAALFYGEPGTGKTLCAEAVATELNRTLLVASVPALKSKWVGETERNLEKLFQEARAHNAVLFLDEADGLLMTRGEGLASRHDDASVNVLLTSLERHEGVVLLATNRPQALDQALARRIGYRLEFPRPTAELRARIWSLLLPETVPTDGEIDVESLGKRFDLTGALIKNAVFKAAFRAARGESPVTMALLEAAAAEEAGESRPVAIGFGVPQPG